MDDKGMDVGERLCKAGLAKMKPITRIPVNQKFIPA